VLTLKIRQRKKKKAMNVGGGEGDIGGIIEIVASR
jgi:hypothetical protein